MNGPYVLQNLYDAAEDLKSAINEIEKDNDECLEPLIASVYRKLNRACNSRNRTNTELLNETSSESERRCRFPSELLMLISD
jgi:hypothetical protein